MERGREMKSRCEGKAERGKTAGNMAGLIKQIQDRFGGNIWLVEKTGK